MSGPVGAAEVAHLALAHQVVQGAQGLFHGGATVPAVDLVKVDMVGAQASQAALHRGHDVLA
jgi:hypothetical protein